MLLKRLSLSFVLLGLSGCTSRSEAPKASGTSTDSSKPVAQKAVASEDAIAPATPAQTTSPATANADGRDEDSKQKSGVASTVRSEAAAPASAAKPPASPYAGLETSQISFYEKVQNTLEPVREGALAGYSKLKAEEHRAKTVIKLGLVNVSLNQSAETRLRATLAQVQKVQPLLQIYHWYSMNLWPVRRDMNKIQTLYDSNNIYTARDALKSTYEAAIDDGVNFKPEIRKLLGEMVRSEGPKPPVFEQDADDLANQLRNKLLDQTVTGDSLFLMAYAVLERGMDIQTRHNWIRKFHILVETLPPPRRTELLKFISSDPLVEEEFDRMEAGITATEAPFRLPAFKEYQEEYVKKRDGFLSEARSAYLQVEKGRRDMIEGHFYLIDSRGWQSLLVLDEVMGEFQKILETILPDLDYRFRRLIPADAPRGVDENVVPRIPIPGSAEERLPSFDLRGRFIVVDSPAGKPKRAEMLKDGSALSGTITLQPNIAPKVTYAAELKIQTGDVEKMKGELLITSPTGEKTVCSIRGKTELGKVTLDSDWNPLQGGSTATFIGTTENGPFAGRVEGIQATGRFSLDLKK